MYVFSFRACFVIVRTISHYIVLSLIRCTTIYLDVDRCITFVYSIVIAMGISYLCYVVESKTKTIYILSGPCQNPEDIFTIDENTKQVKCLPKHHRKIKRIFDVLPSNKNGGAAANCGTPGGKCSGLRAPGFSQLCK